MKPLVKSKYKIQYETGKWYEGAIDPGVDWSDEPSIIQCPCDGSIPDEHLDKPIAGEPLDIQWPNDEQGDDVFGVRVIEGYGYQILYDGEMKLEWSVYDTKEECRENAQCDLANCRRNEVSQ